MSHVYVTCVECEAHVSWCDHPDTHTHQRYVYDLDEAGLRITHMELDRQESITEGSGALGEQS